MTGKKDVMLMEAAIAFAQGLGGAQIDPAALEEFHKRYYDWIDKKKQNPRAHGNSPADVWSTYRGDFLARFREIGQRAAASGTPVTGDALSTAARTIENESDCPYCPIQP